MILLCVFSQIAFRLGPCHIEDFDPTYHVISPRRYNNCHVGVADFSGVDDCGTITLVKVSSNRHLFWLEEQT
jgi:hypothetical protein